MASENELIVSGYFANLPQISDFVGQAASQAGLDERASYAVQMAVDEACTNIVKYAYGGEGKGEIRLIYHIQVDGLQVTIYDQGEPFDPLQVPKLDARAPLVERKQGKMGIFFIRELMDRAEFRFNTPQGNQLILFKKRQHTL